MGFRPVGPRFNWRGVGASQGPRAASTDALVEDARAALAVARDNFGAAPLVASIGGSSAVALALKGDVAGACLVSPPASLIIEEWGSPVWVVVAQSDLSSRVPVATAHLRVIPGADRTFQKNLPWVGRAVVECLNAVETLR